MEQIIAKLLDDFEQGRMSRRQLIKTLTMSTAAASAVGSVAAPAVAADAPFRIVAVNHISYHVADYKRTRDFYADLFGLKATGDKGNQCDMPFGTQGSWLLPRNGRPGTQTPLVDHIAYTIADWDKDRVKAELDKRGLNPRPDTDDSFHIKDPDGFDVQISGSNMKPSTT